MKCKFFLGLEKVVVRFWFSAIGMGFSKFNGACVQ